MGWNQPSEGSSGPKKPDQKASGVVKGATAGFAVVLCAVTAWLILAPGLEEKPQAKRERRAPTMKATAADVAVAVESPRCVGTVASSKTKTNEVVVVKSFVVTNATGSIIEKQVLANGKKVTKVRPPEPLFKNSADQLIALTVSAKPGQAMAPLPDLSNVDADFMKSLLNPLRIEDTDSEEVKTLKGKVLEARAYLREEVKSGKTVREALKAYQAEMEKYADSHLMAVKEIQKIRESDGEEVAREFRERINESFRAQGIPELTAVGNKENQRKKSK